MAYEKIQAYDSAYSIYRSLIDELPILLQSYDAQVKTKHGAGSEKIMLNNQPFAEILESGFDAPPTMEESNDHPLRRMQLFLRPYIAIIDLIEKQRLDGITYANLRRNLSQLNQLIAATRQTPLSSSEEKKLNTDRKDQGDKVRLNTLYSDYFNNVGSILFFKNYNYPELYKKFRKVIPKNLRDKNLIQFLNAYRGSISNSAYDYNPSLTAYFYYHQSISELYNSFESRLRLLFSESNTTDDLVLKASDTPLTGVALLLDPKANQMSNTMQLYSFGNLYSKLGDTVLTFSGHYLKPISASVIALWAMDDTKGNYARCMKACITELRTKDFPFADCLNAALVFYRIAGLFYLRANRPYSYGFQVKKFLFVFKDWLVLQQKEVPDLEDALEKDGQITKYLEDKKTHGLNLSVQQQSYSLLVKTFQHLIAPKNFNVIAWVSDIANRPQILKYRDNFSLDRTTDTVSVYNNVTTSAEVREVVLLIEGIILRLVERGLVGPEPDLRFILTPYDTISSKYLRMMELNYKCDFNFNLFKKAGLTDLLTKDYFKTPEDKIEQNGKYTLDINARLESWNNIGEQAEPLLAAILDSIFCLHEVIRTVNIYGINYIANHSHLANTHYKLANWCRAFENFFYFNWIKNGIPRDSSDDRQFAKREARLKHDQRLINILGTDVIYALEPNYHDEQALQHYYAAIQTHNGGRAYRDNIMNMSFLEDDFNDNLTHFSAASERFRINNGTVRTKIKSLKEQIEHSQVYQYDSYIGKELNLDWEVEF